MASVAAGLAGAQAKAEPLTPAMLIERFCGERLGSWRASAGADERKHSTLHTGFCSYLGRNAYGPGVDGYDDGYDMMGSLQEGGWRVMAEYGDWPYVVYLWWAALESDPRYAVASYCEGDFSIEVFDSAAAAKLAVRALPEAP